MMNDKNLAELINKLEEDKKDFEEQLQGKRKYVSKKILTGDAEVLLHLNRYSEYASMLHFAELIRDIETKLRTLIINSSVEMK